MKLEILKQLNAERAARRPVIIVTDTANGEQRLVNAADIAADPLRAELIRCQRLGEAGPRDPACLSAWAESRERFLARGARPGVRATRAIEIPAAPADAAREGAMPDDPAAKAMAPLLDEAR